MMHDVRFARFFAPAAVVVSLFALPAVADHPDGDIEQAQMFWQPSTGLELMRLSGHARGPVLHGKPGSVFEGAPDAQFVFTGSDPEGDAPSDVAYTPDGRTIVIAHRESRNLILWDADTLAFVGAIPISGAAQSLAITPDGSKAVVANIDNNTVSIVDLGSMSETSVISVGTNPGYVAISPAGDLAAVAIGFDGQLQVIDISSASVVRTIDDIGYGVRFSFSTEPPASSIQYTKFFFVDNDRVINADLGDDEMQIINVRTGSVARTPIADSAAGLAVSGDLSTAIITHSYSARTLTVVDTASGTITDTVVPAFDLTGPVAINADGSIATVAAQNAARVFDVTSGTFGPSLDTASINELLATFDGRYAVGVGFRGAVIDMQTGAYVRQVNNVVSTEHGALSPTDYQAAMCSTTFGDDLVVADVEGSMGSLTALMRSGPEVEGDRCRTIAMSHDGSTAVGVSIFSDTATIVDTSTGTVTGVAPLGERPNAVAITPDGSTAVVGNLDSTYATIVDLASGTSTDVEISRRAGSVAISPDGQYAYLGVVASGDGVWRIDLNTNTVAGPKIITGNMGGVGYSFSQNSGITLSPDGSVLAVAGSFDDVVSIIDTASWSLAANLPAGDFPTMVSFSPDGDRMYVTNRDGDSVSFYDSSGAVPSFLATLPVGDSPWQTVDDGKGKLWVNNWGDSRVSAYDSTTGALLGSVNFATPPVGLTFDASTNTVRVAHGTVSTSLGGEAGFSMTQSGTVTVVDADDFSTEVYDLGVGPSALASSADGNTLAVAAPIGDGMAILNLSAGCNAADIAEPYGELNFFDVSAFLVAFNAGDLSVDFNNDEVLNFFDVSAFLKAFGTGCP
ncbi:MAG: GC-type dockerin domain-anchored protein [Phycisphaerales bacterium JB047]